MGRIIGFTDLEQQEILRQAQEFWNDATRKMESYFIFVNEMERLTRVLLPQSLQDAFAKYPDRSRLVPPDIYNNMNSLKALIRRVLFRKKPYFPLELIGEWNNVSERVEKMEQLLQMIMDQEGEGKGFPFEAAKAIYQALYAGLTVVVTRWHKDWGKVPRRDPATGMILAETPIPSEPDYKVPAFDYKVIQEYPETVSLDVRRVRLDTNAGDVSNIRIVGYQGQRQLSDLIELNNNKDSHYQFDAEKLAKSTFNKSRYYQHVGGETGTTPDKTGMAVAETYGDKPIETWSIRGLFRLKQPDGSFKTRDLIVEIGNEFHLLALKDNDLPLRGWELFDYPRIEDHHGRMYSMGVVEPARDVFLEGFIKRNQSLDSANRNVHNTYIADAGVQDMGDYLESANDRVYKIDTQSSGLVDVRQAVAVLDRPALGQDTFQHSQICKRDTQQTMRLSDYMQSTTPETPETATGVAALVSGGQSTTEDMIDMLSDTYFTPCSRKKLILWMFFKGHLLTNVTLGDGTKAAVTLDDLMMAYQVSVRSSISANNVTQQRRVVEIMSIVMNDPYYDPIEVRKMVNEVLDLPNGNRLLVNQDNAKQYPLVESMLMGYGADWQVHPLDQHRLHLDVHTEYLKFIEQKMVQGASDLTTEKLIRHIQEHEVELQQQQVALGNTKEMGGNTGNLVQPDGASMGGQPTGATGQYMASGSRA